MNPRPTRILIVEDESAHAEAIHRSLEGLQAVELRLAGNLGGFRRCVTEWPPDLVLMDLNLPDGRATEILPDPAGARTFPVVVMTSYGSEETAVQALKLGAFDYLVKSPETFGGLARTVERQLREWKALVDRKRIHRELEASEAKHRSLAENILDGIFRFDRQGRHTFVNPAAQSILGLRAEELLGRTHAECGFPVEVVRFWEDALAQVVRTGQPLKVEVQFPGASGWATHDCRLNPEFDGCGQVSSVLVVSRDVTERKLAEEERRQLQARLQQAQKMDSLGSLAGGVAHDMNNVLGAILGLASANLASQPPGSATRQAFETIIKAAERGGGMVRGLLTFARQGPAETRELDLNGLLRDEVRLLERTTLAKVRLELSLEEGLPPVLGDAGALAHALMNLCVNAVDAMPEGGCLRLVTRQAKPGWVEVRVEDNGTGMPAEVLERALDPFFTTKEPGKGTGLGLSMAFNTVKAHGGRLDLWSEPGRGTRVSLAFPVCRAPREDGAPGAHAGAAPSAGRLRVLLVDDDDLIQSSVQMLLEVLGHEAASAMSGEDALALIEGGYRPDLVIMDMNMPGLGGAGTLPRLRRLLPSVPVLLATGRADQTALDLVGSQAGVTLLAKPFALEDLEQGLKPFLAVGTA